MTHGHQEQVTVGLPATDINPTTADNNQVTETQVANDIWLHKAPSIEMTGVDPEADPPSNKLRKTRTRDKVA